MNKHSHRLVFSRSLGFCVAVAETVASSGKSASGEGPRGTVKASVALALAAASFALQAQGMPGAGAALTGFAPRPTLAAAGVASTLPTGATVVKGSGSISVSGTNMTVDQTSQRLVTDWQSFSIGANNSVRFIQPSSSSVALNRVTGDDASNIFGSLTANGHVYLENANGVYFAPGAQVSVGSLLATSLIVDTDQFMLGNLRLSGGSTSSGEVSNAGNIVAAPGGHVILAGPLVSNTGSITTPGGTTALVAGNAVNVDPTGSGLLTISVPAAAVNARLAQSGTITADGGAVQLAAAATDAALRTVMQVGGVVRARSIEQRDGQILLSGGSSGVVMVDGQLDASGGANVQGGTIKVLGDRVGLTGAAHLDASGGVGGGTILVGGNMHGAGTEQNASETYVGSGVVLDASATTKGDGGTVVVWSDDHTTYAGNLVARGGVQGGNGGQAEVSGKNTLDFQGGSDLSAPKGTIGHLLLDPNSIDIGLTADVNNDGTQGDDVTVAGLSGTTGPDSKIKATTVATLLASNNLSLQAGSGGITVSAPLTVAAGGLPTTLTLNTLGITFNAAVSLSNASLVATAPSGITVAAPLSSLKSISLGSGDITINAPLSAANLSLLSGSISTNVINQDTGGAGTITADTLTIGPGAGFGRPDTAHLDFSANKIGTLNVNAGSLYLTATNDPGVPLIISGNLSTQLTVAATNTSITQGTLAGDALSVRGGVQVSTIGSGDILLTNPANQFSGSFAFTGAGNVDVFNVPAFGPTGSATGNITLQTDGLFTLNGTMTGFDIDVTSVGFHSYYSTFVTAPAGHYTIHSSDYSQDYFYGPLQPGSGAGNINYIVYGGYTGAAPTSGNGLFTNQTGSIAPLVTDAPPISKVYDGSPAFTYTQTGGPASGTLNGFYATPVTLTSYSINGSGSFVDKNAGTNKGLTVAASNDTQAVSSTQNGAVDYGLQFAGYTRAAGPHRPGTPGNDIAEITAKPIFASGINGVDRVYDATTIVGLDASGGTLSGVVGGDTVTLVTTSATGSLANKNVGTNKTVAVTGLTLGGADGGNYTVTDPLGTTATITARGIMSHGITGVGRAYDGTTTVAVNGSAATLTGVLAGDTVGVVTTAATGSVTSKDVGTGKPVVVTGVTLNGADGGNYTVTDASGATVAITPRGITSTGIDGVDRVYDGTTTVALNTAGAGLAGVIAGDTVNLVSTGATGTLGNKNVGTNKPVAVSGLSLGGADAGDYTVADGGGATATITPLAITASGITGVNRVYNGTTVVAVNGSGATLSGVLGGDVVTVNATGATGTASDKNVGTGKPVAVTGVALGGADGGNYTVTDPGGTTVNITPLGITSTGVTGVDRTYDGTTVVGVSASAASLSGTIAGDNVAIVATGASGTIADKNVGVAKPVTVNGLALGGTDAANYTLTDASNATVNITALVIQATGITAVNRADNGTTVVGLNTSRAGLDGVLAGDTVGVDASGAVGSVASPNPGEAKPVTVSGIVLTGADALDYSVSPIPVSLSGGPLTVSILTVAQSRFDDLRFKEYLQGVADAQEPFRRAMLEALLSGFGKENIRKQLQRGLVFETGLAPPAVDIIDSAKAPESCTPNGADLSCGH